MDLWRGFMEGQAGEAFSDVNAVLDDQRAFSKLARQVISDLGYGDQLGEDPDLEDEDDQSEAEPEEGSEDQSEPGGDDQDSSDDQETESQDSDSDQMDTQQAEVSYEIDNDAEMAEDMEAEDGEPPLSSAERGTQLHLLLELLASVPPGDRATRWPPYPIRSGSTR